MKSYSVEAFVLRLRPLGEADRILTLFSRERGKITAVAKSARKTQSKFGARLDFFARSAITLHTGRSLDLITGANLISGAWERLVEPDVFAFASYIAEVIDGTCEPDLPIPDLYETLCELQEALAAGAPPSLLQPAADLRILAALGVAPELDACARCGAPLGRRPFAAGRAALSPEAGGLVCRRCLDSGTGDDDDVRREFDVVRMTSGDFALLRDARGLTFAEAAQRPALAATGRATYAFVRHLLGRASRALTSTSRQGSTPVGAPTRATGATR